MIEHIQSLITNIVERGGTQGAAKKSLGTPMRTIVNRLSQSDSAEAWKQVMSVSYSRSADCICLAYYNALTEVLPVPRIL